MKRLHLYYSGNVQGVGFRYSAVDCASNNNIKGWVRNLPDGRVEVMAEGEGKDLDKFQSDLRNIMSYYIRGEEEWKEEAKMGEFEGFRIKY